ncbi:BCCT family transporter [Eilatimonas milleporae]|uniref:Choline/glycine/proline betaine transport protein n=1 Tax=Eilatimonas milleporae TaxID=911205 RepID=A0A3M0BZG0_9PROT|nr:BCCT family transporter [Eilatimonas milleporae]RMB02878.1 choline/glycine/proline betaine transport protein [Eilatimonas milleporae]
MIYGSDNPLEGQLRAGVLPAVFLPAALLILVLVVFAAGFPETAGAAFSGLNTWILDTWGWFYALAVTGFLVFALMLAFSRFGATRLGPDDATPDYSFASWFAMLFSAGMGIGLMFFAVAEPVMHYTLPPTAAPRTVAAAREAMQATFFHWGVHGWAVYGAVGLTLAYFGYRHKLPLTIRSALYPLIGERIYGPVGHAVDVFAVLGTLFGVATSLGFGVAQVNSGLSHLFGLPMSTGTQIVLIAAITAVATVSVVSGLNVGIKRLSEMNLVLALALLLFVIAVGPTVLIFGAFAENLGGYAWTLIDRSLRVGIYGADGDWIGTWTIFYWGWWISWSPFVGMFIARVSRGRTIREFVLGVLLVPSLLTFLWMTSFGNTALDMIDGGATVIADRVTDNLPVALFVFLEQFPLSEVVSLVATVLVISFFVTSSDSGSLVIDIITAGGRTDNPVWQRVFWAVSEGLVAAVLLLAGGLAALQAAAVATALPFAMVLIFALVGLMRGLLVEATKARGAEVAPDIAPPATGMPWKIRLNAILSQPTRERVDTFLAETVRPALQEVSREVTAHDCTATAFVDSQGAVLTIRHVNEPDFRFAVQSKGYRAPAFTFADTDPEVTRPETHYRAEVFLAEGGQDYDIYGYTREQIIHEVLNQYNRHMHFLHLARDMASSMN